MYLLSRKILIWIVNIKSQEKKVVKIFINPVLYKISPGVTFKQFNIFKEIYSEKNDILLAPGCFDLRIKEQNQTKTQNQLN